MTDIIGSIAIPTTTPAVGIVAGFPELGYIAEFCKSVLNVDALAHWHAVAPDTLPVLSAFTHDPKLLLDDSKLPSIYCFGVESEGNYTGTDITTLTTSVSVWWLMEPCQDEQATLRDPCRILMARVLDNALSGGRNPAWIVPGDTDPYASDWGSSLTGYIGAWKKIQVSKFSMLSVELPIIDGRGKTSLNAMATD